MSLESKRDDFFNSINSTKKHTNKKSLIATKTEVTLASLDVPLRGNLKICDSAILENNIESNISGVTEVTEVTASNDKACRGNPDKKNRGYWGYLSA